MELSEKRSRIMAIDYGQKRLGLAISDPLGIIAQGLGVIERKGKKKDIQSLKDLIEENGVGEVVLGLPRSLSGGEGTLQEEVENFGRRLEAGLGIKVAYQDERFTTAQAERVLIDADVSRKKRRGVIDKMAAQLILQNYLDVRPKEDK